MKFLIIPSVANFVAFILIWLQFVNYELFNPILETLKPVFEFTSVWAIIGIIIICSYEYGKQKRINI